MASAGSAIPTAGHDRRPSTTANDPNARLKDFSDILNPGVTSRSKGYAEPAPDTATLAEIGELTANDPALLPEGISELAADLMRHRRFILAVVFGQPALRHPEGPEQDVPERECAGEICVPAVFEPCVMPAMED